MVTGGNVEVAELVYTNIEEWRRRTGREPSLASTSASVTPVYSPIFVEHRMRLKGLWVLNGATGGGSAKMGIFRVTPRSKLMLNPTVLSFDTGLVSTWNGWFGASTWQEFTPAPYVASPSLIDFILSPGLYMVGYVSDGMDKKVQTLYTPVNAASREGAILGGLAQGATAVLDGLALTGYPSTLDALTVPVMAISGDKVTW